MKKISQKVQKSLWRAYISFSELSEKILDIKKIICYIFFVFKKEVYWVQKYFNISGG